MTRRKRPNHKRQSQQGVAGVYKNGQNPITFDVLLKEQTWWGHKAMDTVLEMHQMAGAWQLRGLSRNRAHQLAGEINAKAAVICSHSPILE